ncbi:hypothetical protein, partial [uncultured Mucilaginibacter sp.]|uniref:hypothetical protein n=1 Tax=uncultured Mucilaginibacter sp. TaxID=797541 RepID=UPI0025E312CD
MSNLGLVNTAAPSTPASTINNIYVDSTAIRTNQIDAAGIINVLNNHGLVDRNVITNGGFNIQQRVATASTAITGISTTTRGGVVADAWSVTYSVASNVNWAQIDSGTSIETGLTSRYYGSIISA